MAKKKSKKGNSSLGKILYFVAAVLGIVSIAMMFVDVAKYDVLNESVGFSGFQVAFGYTNELDVKTLEFSFMALLPYILALAGTVIVLANAFAKKGGKILDIISVVAFVASAVLFFSIPNFMVFGKLAVISKSIEYELAVGAIISAICAILSAVVVLMKTLLKK